MHTGPYVKGILRGKQGELVIGREKKWNQGGKIISWHLGESLS